MTLKRYLALSLVLGVAAGLAAYALAWGFFTTHPELGIEPARGRLMALCVAPLAFLASLIYFATRKRQR